MHIPPSLKVKMAGLPRWAWIALLVGGVGVGLYLHAANAETEGEGEEESEELPGASPQSIEGYEGAEAGGSLVGLGAAGPAAASPGIPVESPVVPEGITQVIGEQGDTIQSLANGVIESNLASSELARELADRPAPEAPEGSKEIIREKMVGHPAKRKTHHMPPREKPKAKKPAKKAKQATKHAKHAVKKHKQKKHQKQH